MVWNNWARKLVTISVLVSSASALGFQSYNSQDAVTESSDEQNYSNFFTVDDKGVSSQPAQFIQPTALSQEFIQTIASKLNLLTWDKHNSELPVPTEKYNRKKHYGEWIIQGDGCQNTRTKILIRDSETPVKFKDDKECVVTDGKWNDPYTGTSFHKSTEVQIDHVVPLKHSYEMGAWKWNQEKRCLYANYLSNDFHLLAVSGPENMKKGAMGPDRYMPPNEEFACSYVQIWLSIKLIWNMAITPPEAQAMSQIIKTHACKTPELEVARNFIAKQRQDILQNQDICR